MHVLSCMHFEGEGRRKNQRRCCYEPVLPSSFKLRHHMILLIFLVSLSIQLQLQPLPLPGPSPPPPTMTKATATRGQLGNQVSGSQPCCSLLTWARSTMDTTTIKMETRYVAPHPTAQHWPDHAAQRRTMMQQQQEGKTRYIAPLPTARRWPQWQWRGLREAPKNQGQRGKWPAPSLLYSPPHAVTTTHHHAATSGWPIVISTTMGIIVSWYFTLIKYWLTMKTASSRHPPPSRAQGGSLFVDDHPWPPSLSRARKFLYFLVCVISAMVMNLMMELEILAFARRSPGLSPVWHIRRLLCHLGLFMYRSPSPSHG